MKERIGTLNQQITIATPTATQNSYGEEEISWSISSEVWANVNYLPASDEKLIADQQTGVTRVNFTIRNRTGLTTRHELRYDSKVFKILSLLPSQDRCYLVIETESFA